MIKVYIASPYSKGDQGLNVKRQMDVAEELMAAGFCPIIPLLLHFQHIAHPRTYEHWLQISREWLQGCDAVLRLPGESYGADQEELLAHKTKIPVYHSVEALLYSMGV